jgi:hypothetical protein
MSHRIAQSDSYNWESNYVDGHSYLDVVNTTGTVVQASGPIRVRGIHIRVNTAGMMGVYNGDYSTLYFTLKMGAAGDVPRLRAFYSPDGLALKAISAGAARCSVRFHQYP